MFLTTGIKIRRLEYGKLIVKGTKNKELEKLKNNGSGVTM